MLLPDGVCVSVRVCTLMGFEVCLFARICFTLTYINEPSVCGCSCVFSVEALGIHQKDLKLLSTVNVLWGLNTKPCDTGRDRGERLRRTLQLTFTTPVCKCVCSCTTPQICDYITGVKEIHCLSCEGVSCHATVCLGKILGKSLVLSYESRRVQVALKYVVTLHCSTLH